MRHVQGVQVPKHGLPNSNQPVVDQRNDASEDGRRTTCPFNKQRFTSIEDYDPFALGRDIWKGTTRGVEQARIS